MWGRVPRRRLAGGTPVDYANDIRVIDGRGDNYSKVWIRGAYLRDITRQIAISRADLHRTCRDVASPNEMCIIYVRTSVCARAQVFSRRVEMDRGDETFLIMIRRVSQSIEWNRHFSIISVANWLKILGMVIFFSIQIIRIQVNSRLSNKFSKIWSWHRLIEDWLATKVLRKGSFWRRRNRCSVESITWILRALWRTYQIV